jgi:hypothetical protein
MLDEPMYSSFSLNHIFNPLPVIRIPKVKPLTKLQPPILYKNINIQDQKTNENQNENENKNYNLTLNDDIIEEKEEFEHENEQPNVPTIVEPPIIKKQSVQSNSFKSNSLNTSKLNVPTIISPISTSISKSHIFVPHSAPFLLSTNSNENQICT